MHRSKIEWVLNPDNKTLGWVWNPITGCLNGCPYCYARKLANGRLRKRYLKSNIIQVRDGKQVGKPQSIMSPGARECDLYDPFYPRFWPERLKDIERPPYPFSAWVANAPNTAEWMATQPPNFHAKRKKIGIFTCNMSDLFGIGIPEEWTQQVLDVIDKNNIDRFYLLTKQPQNLPAWSPFPQNVYLGVSVTNEEMLDRAIYYLKMVNAKVKFLSFEPLLGHIVVDKPLP